MVFTQVQRESYNAETRKVDSKHETEMTYILTLIVSQWKAEANPSTMGTWVIKQMGRTCSKKEIIEVEHVRTNEGTHYPKTLKN